MTGRAYLILARKFPHTKRESASARALHFLRWKNCPSEEVESALESLSLSSPPISKPPLPPLLPPPPFPSPPIPSWPKTLSCTSPVLWAPSLWGLLRPLPLLTWSSSRRYDQRRSYKFDTKPVSNVPSFFDIGYLLHSRPLAAPQR